MSFLQRLAGRAKEKASQAYDTVNFLDNGLSWNTRQVNPEVANRSSFEQFRRSAPVQSVVTTGQKAANTLAAGGAGAIGLGNVGYQSAFGTDQSYKNALAATQSTVDEFLNTGVGNKGAYLSAGQSKTQGDGLEGLKSNFLKPTAQVVAEIAPLVAPIGAVGAGAKLGSKIAIQGGLNAGVGAATDASLQLLNTGKIDPKQLAAATAISGAVGGAFPAAGAAAKSLAKVPKNIANMNEVGAVGKNVKPVFGNNDDFVYHLDYTNAAPQSFADKGILPSKKGYAGKGVYMANTPENTLYNADRVSKGTMYRINKQKLIDQYGQYGKDNPNGRIEYDETTGEVMMLGDDAITPNLLEVKGKDGKWSAVQGELPDSVTLGKKDLIYHGTSSKDADSLIKNGFNPALSKGKLPDSQESPFAMFASKSNKADGDHSAGTYGDTILEVRPKSDAKMLNANSQTWMNTMGRSMGAKDSARIANELKAKGYDGIVETNGEITIFSPDKFAFARPGKKQLPETFYHGTAKGNNFTKFDSSKANTGVGNNAFNQGDLVYITPRKDAATEFSRMATEKQELRSGQIDDMSAIGKTNGEVMPVALAKDSKVVTLDKPPTAEQMAKYKQQGYDAVRFKDDAWKAMAEGNPRLAEMYEKGVPETIAVLNPDKVSIKNAKKQLPKKDSILGNASSIARQLLDDEGGSIAVPGGKGKKQLPQKPVPEQSQMSPDSLPGSISPKQKPATLPESIKNSPGTDQDLVKLIENNGYTVKPNAETLGNAVKTLQENPLQLLDEVMGMKVGGGTQLGTKSITGKALPNADQVAKSMVTIDYLSRNGMTDQANEIVKNLTKQSTALGQAVQVLAAYGRTTPTGIYMYATKLADKAGIELPPGTVDDLVKRAKDIETMPNGRQKEVSRALLLKDAAEVVPSSAADKAAMYLYLAQLLNIKTAARNVIGNSFMLAGQNISDIGAAGLDIARVGAAKAIGKDAQRQVFAPNVVKQAQDFSRGLKYGLEDAKLGVDSRGINAGRMEEGVQQNVFKNKFGRGAETALSAELGAFDRAFFETSSNQLKRNLMKGQGLSKATPEIEAAADAFGRYMTFQDDTALARVAIGLKKTLNVNKPFGAGNFIINYPKTPANLINRSVAFSPLGYTKAVMELYKVARGRSTALEVEQAIARASVGSGGLVGAGALLHNLGIIEGQENKNKTDLNAFNRAFGGGSYTINTSALKRYVLSGFDESQTKKRPGDINVSYDWAQPLSSSLTMGAALDQYNKSDKSFKQKIEGVGGKVAVGAVAGLQSIAEQPLFTGVQEAFNAQDPFAGAFNVAKSAPASLVPAVVRQTRQAIDPTARNTYSDNPFAESFKKVQNSIPGLSTGLPANIDPTTGQDQKVFQSGNQIFNAYANPTFVSKVSGDNVSNELRRLYELEGDAKVIPNTVKKAYEIDGKNRVLSTDEYQKMQQFVGDKNDQYLKDLLSDSKYQRADDATKSKMVSAVLQDVSSAAKRSILGAGKDKKDRGADAIAAGKAYKTDSKGGTSKLTDLPSGMNGYDVETLERFDGLESTEKDKIIRSEKDAEYKLTLAEYERDKKAGNLSTVQEVRRKKDLLKAKAGKDFNKDVRELATLSKKDIYNLVTTDPDGQRLADELVAYGDSLVSNGVYEKNNFRDKYGRVALAPKTSSGGRKGGGGGKAKIVPYKSQSGEIAQASSGSKRNANTGRIRKAALNTKFKTLKTQSNKPIKMSKPTNTTKLKARTA